MSDKSAKESRKYDVIVWGASGFTGRLVAEYLAGNYTGRLNWAVAGRNRTKLEQVIAELGIAAANNGGPEILLADSHDRASLDTLTANTRVVITTVGPYALYGDELVDACVRNGTDYCDLAGEVQWMRRVIDRNQAAAEKSGARIVHSCGFDSIPSDLGVLFLQNHARETHGETCRRIELLVKAMRGGGSGGTIASALNSMEERRRDREVARVMADPYSLNPAGQRTGPDGRDQQSAVFNDLARAWTAPFIMGVINMRVVRRSNALLGYPYGKDFRYNESVLTGKGAGGWMKSAAYTAGLGAFFLTSSFDLSRRLIIEKFLPKPGEGPDREERENGFFNMLLLGELPDGSVLRARVTGDRDPGYGSTSKMLSESAICLARGESSVNGGCWTPASAMGSALIKRLTDNAGLRFEIEGNGDAAT